MKKILNWFKERAYMPLVIFILVAFAFFYFSLPEIHYKAYKDSYSRKEILREEVNLGNLNLNWVESNCECLDWFDEGTMKKSCINGMTFTKDCLPCKTYACNGGYILIGRVNKETRLEQIL